MSDNSPAPLPRELLPYRKAAEEGLRKGCIQEIAFSGRKYQILVVDPKTEEEFWTLLQFDDEGHVQDLLCFCDEIEEIGCCVHVAMAFLRIFQHAKEALHQRFAHSFWNVLGQQLLLLHGDELASLEKNEKERIFFLPDDRFSIQAHTASAWEALLHIFEDRGWETEENSIKFSHFSEEDLEAWRRGRPPFLLRYELSPWAELAKRWLLCQDEGEECRIAFSYDREGVPEALSFSFSPFHVSTALTREALTALISVLPKVESPLSVETPEKESLDEIVYDAEKGVLHLHYHPFSATPLSTKEGKGIPLGDWIYIPKKGFYLEKREERGRREALQEKEIGIFLSENFDQVEAFLHNVHRDVQEIQYTIDFDDRWNLHLIAYLHEKGDLEKPRSRVFGDWVFVEEKGFFPVTGWRFPHLHTTIPTYHVADFVRQHRAWLQTQKDFQTYGAVEKGALLYEVTETRRLSFFQEKKRVDKKRIVKDFGPYLYVEGEGFYTKMPAERRFPLRPGITIPAEQIPLFIASHEEELRHVPGFFHAHCPVQKAELEMILNEKEDIVLRPRYTLDPAYDADDVRFFDEYVYVPGEGFSPMEGPALLPEGYRHPCVISPKEYIRFFSEEIPTITHRIIARDRRLQSPHELTLIAKHITKSVDEETERYAATLYYQTEWGHISLRQLWKLLHSKKRFAFTQAGLIDLTDKRFQWIRKFNEASWDKKHNRLYLSPLQLLRMNALDPFHLVEEKTPEYEESRRLLLAMTEAHISEAPNTFGLLSHLRPYQETGLHWLWFLYHYRLSGLLCDEMGLGKTHQAMGLIAAVKNHFRKKEEENPPKILVVCPTSVLYHWQEKLQEFFPSITVCPYFGLKRSLADFSAKYEILLTSYGTLRNDQEKLANISFELAFFDEIQVAKNVQSQIYRALRRIKARSRFGLTGTPIENHLRELKTLFDLVLPTYMPSEKEYRELFIKPIERGKDHQRKEVLSRLIHPFVLRRKKQDVLVDLPAKIEEVSHCDLLGDQEPLYREVLRQGRSQLLNEIQDPRQPVPYLHVFALLTHLKQICDHPAVYNKRPLEYREHASGKWELFKELLNEALESEQKVVVYTQYLHMLDILGDYLHDIGVPFASIRGATTNRGEQVARFQKDPKYRVFIGSLQAAGLGIDLTAASVVIHYDRWWNAARENQATDRVHRIGQTKGVSVFKLVTLGTFEERIDQLIEKKRHLLEEVVGVDDANVIKQFTREEIMQLLNDV